jgi:hypothetical protein
MRKAAEVAIREARALVPVTIYFVIAFNLVAFTKTLMLREYGIRVSTFAAATFGALVVAKVVLIAELLPFMEPFPRIPIMYNAAWKTLIYWLVALVVQIVEDSIAALYKHGSLASALDDLSRPHFWMVQMWLIVLFLVFCTFQELMHAIGPQRAKELFLGVRSGARS